MRYHRLHNVEMTRFCRWSRKAYAAFASLRKHVTVGVVCKGITEVALSKGKSLLTGKAGSFGNVAVASGDSDYVWANEDDFTAEKNKLTSESCLMYARKENECQGNENLILSDKLIMEGCIEPIAFRYTLPFIL